MLLSQMPLPVAILYTQCYLLYLQATNKIQKSNLIPWGRKPLVSLGIK